MSLGDLTPAEFKDQIKGGWEGRSAGSAVLPIISGPINPGRSSTSPITESMSGYLASGVTSTYTVIEDDAIKEFNTDANGRAVQQMP